MIVELYSSAFCGPCRSTRAVLHRAAQLVPTVTVVEVDVADEVARAEAARITTTPTVLVRDGAGVEVFRATGTPSLPHVLSALDRALTSPANP